MRYKLGVCGVLVKKNLSCLFASKGKKEECFLPPVNYLKALSYSEDDRVASEMDSPTADYFMPLLGFI